MSHTKKERELIEMIKRCTEGKGTAEEIHFLDLYYEIFENQPEVLETKSEEETKAIGKNVWTKITDANFFPFKKRGKAFSIAFKSWYNVAAAASVILMVAVGMYFFKPTHSTEIAKNIAPKKIKNDAVPGGNKAILTLSNGTNIILDSVQNGKLTQQGNSNVIKLNEGQLAYESTDSNKQKAAQYNTISTPRGGQYQLILSDGSKVWLNAASSISFPTAFVGNERDVSITGEAYFEVTHNAKMPFHVKVGDMVVQVLGTHFNVNAYKDEDAIKTTLLQGSVKVTKGNENTLIVPGEQAVISEKGSITVKKDVDLEEVVAWKDGLFNFNDADLKTIMQQLSRWYDVNIIYSGKIPNREFGGEMQRDLNLSQVLQLLAKNNIHFRIEGKNLFVEP